MLLAALPGSLGVNCSSFTDSASCQNTVTDAGVCGWDDAAQKCVVTSPLPFGELLQKDSIHLLKAPEQWDRLACS